MKAARYIVFATVGALAVATGLYFGSKSKQLNPQNPEAGVALLFQQKSLDAQGKPQDFSQWRGKILVVNFWATWCPPCIEEMPELAELQRNFQNKNVQFVGIGIDSADKISDFLRKNQNIDYPLLVAGAAGIELARTLGNTSGGLPYTVLIDQQGRIQQLQSGRVRREALAAWLEKQISSQK